MEKKQGIKTIDYLIELYTLSDKDAEKMRNAADEYHNALKDYFWEDIKKSIDSFWRWKNDKTRPKLAQIIATLETETKLEKNIQEMSPEQARAKQEFQATQKSRLTGLRRFKHYIWNHYAINEFWYQGEMWPLAWENFNNTIYKIDNLAIQALEKQITIWDFDDVSAKRVVALNKKELAELREIIRTEKL